MQLKNWNDDVILTVQITWNVLERWVFPYKRMCHRRRQRHIPINAQVNVRKVDQFCWEWFQFCFVTSDIASIPCIIVCLSYFKSGLILVLQMFFGSRCFGISVYRKHCITLTSLPWHLSTWWAVDVAAVKMSRKWRSIIKCFIALSLHIDLVMAGHYQNSVYLNYWCKDSKTSEIV